MACRFGIQTRPRKLCRRRSLRRVFPPTRLRTPMSRAWPRSWRRRLGQCNRVSMRTSKRTQCTPASLSRTCSYSIANRHPCCKSSIRPRCRNHHRKCTSTRHRPRTPSSPRRRSRTRLSSRARHRSILVPRDVASTTALHSYAPRILTRPRTLCRRTTRVAYHRSHLRMTTSRAHSRSWHQYLARCSHLVWSGTSWRTVCTSGNRSQQKHHPWCRTTTRPIYPRFLHSRSHNSKSRARSGSWRRRSARCNHPVYSDTSWRKPCTRDRPQICRTCTPQKILGFPRPCCTSSSRQSHHNHHHKCVGTRHRPRTPRPPRRRSRARLSCRSTGAPRPEASRAAHRSYAHRIPTRPRTYFRRTPLHPECRRSQSHKRGSQVHLRSWRRHLAQCM